jgi:hypothetical protein
MSIITSITKIGEVVATWLDPERREKAVLRKAIEAADELLRIYEHSGRYQGMPDKKIQLLKIHYYKQWNAWKDGV